ncbi:MAG TPA: type II secretion system F family protein [Lacipirellulaceae bacterium]|jgi:tight adherence protein C|nr:type II secretion system F family protein [Lacipirellulaceae bacterium]
MDALLNNLWFQHNGWMIASLFMAAAVAVCSYEVLTLATYPRDLLGDSHPFERQRREELRTGSFMYRWFEPLVDELAKLIGGRNSALDSLRQNLVASREKLPWKPEEFLAVKWLEGALSGGGVFLALWLLGWPTMAALFGVSIALLYGLLTPKTIHDRAKKRLARVRLRLPFAVDLIALTMEAGGGFQECLQTAVSENGDHPLTDELAEVLRQISLGRPRSEALKALEDRLQDEDIKEMVFAINKGEELGTPLSAILRDQAEQMRLKRSQRGEKAAAEAEVKIVFPGMVLMIACLLVVIAPIILPAIFAIF